MTVDRFRWEFIRKMMQGPFHGFRTQSIHQPGYQFLQGLRAFLFPVLFEHQVKDLVNQTHGIDIPGSDSFLRMLSQITLLIHLLCKSSSSMEICKDHVPVRLEQSLFEIVTVSCLPGDVKLHHGLKFVVVIHNNSLLEHQVFL